MPVWGVVISTQQVSDLISYLRAGLPAVPTAEAPAIPQGQGLAVEGATLYVRYGCINCHGPNGLGGVRTHSHPTRRFQAFLASISVRSSTPMQRSSGSFAPAA
jgi:cytochrome c